MRSKNNKMLEIEKILFCLLTLFLQKNSLLKSIILEKYEKNYNNLGKLSLYQKIKKRKALKNKALNNSKVHS